jgi:uncharacterized protein
MACSARACRVVLDTNVCLDLLLFADPRCAVLARALADGSLLAITREDCRAEWQRVLRYPALRLDAMRCAELEHRYDALVSPCPTADPGAVALPRCSDPDDQKFLEVARDARVSALLTRDAALLSLAGRLQRSGLFTILPPDAITPAWLRGAGVDVPT